MTELERLKDRLYGPNGMGTKHFHVSLAEGTKATAEEIAAELNKAFDAIEAGDYEEIFDIDGDLDPNVKLDSDHEIKVNEAINKPL